MLMIVGTASVQTSFFTGVCVIRLNLSCVVSSRFTRLHIPIISEEYSIMQVKEDVKPCSETLRILREEYGFGGYIHAKAIPGADDALLSRLGQLAD